MYKANPDVYKLNLTLKSGFKVRFTLCTRGFALYASRSALYTILCLRQNLLVCEVNPVVYTANLTGV